MDEDQERRLAEALERDLPLLWEYALEALVAALLRKAYPLPETQDRILQAHQSYVNAGLRRRYVRWRWDNPDAPVKDFLAQAPAFALPPLPRGTTQKKKEETLPRAAYDYQTVLSLLQFRNQVKETRQYRNLGLRKQAIKAVVQEGLGLPDSQELEEKLHEWQRLSREDIALEAAAWVNGLKPTYLERYRSKAREKYESVMLAQRHTAAAKVKHEATLLKRQTDPTKPRSSVYTPVERELYQKQLRLRDRVRHAKN